MSIDMSFFHALLVLCSKESVRHGKIFFSYALQNDAPGGRFTQAHIDQNYNRHWLVARAQGVKRHAEAPYYEGIGKKDLPMPLTKGGMRKKKTPPCSLPHIFSKEMVG
jgi:hypothetical protein